MHRERERRHGHVHQTRVRVLELKPYMREIEKILKQAPAILPAMEAQWKDLVADCKAGVALRMAGRATNRWEHAACAEVVKLGEQVEFKDILVMGLALFLLYEKNPHRFASDRAFKFQLCRRIRCLNDVNCGVYYDHRINAQRRVYKVFRPRATMVLADKLVKLLARPAGHVMRMHREEAQRRQAVDKAFEQLREVAGDKGYLIREWVG
jgi:hypothetical protein